MKKVCALLVCAALFFGMPLVSHAILCGGETAVVGESGGGASDPREGESGDSVWDVEVIAEEKSTVYAAVGSQPVLSVNQPMYLRDQYGNRRGIVYMMVDWGDRLYDTETVGEQVIYGTVRISGEWMSEFGLTFNRDVYTVALKLVVLEPQPPDLLGSEPLLRLQRDGTYRLTLNFPLAIGKWDKLRVLISLDEGEAWEEPELCSASQSGSSIVIGPLEEKATYHIRLTVEGSGLVKGTSEILVMHFEANSITLWGMCCAWSLSAW